MGKLKILAYIGIAFLVGLTIYSIVEGIITNTSGFGGLGFSIGAAWLSIPTTIGNGIAGVFSSFFKLIQHYLNPLNWWINGYVKPVSYYYNLLPF